MAAIGFDVYGTLVDPLAMSGALASIAGERAGEMAAIWRTKQLEYTFRRTLMDAYENFDTCTLEALRYAAETSAVRLSGGDEERLLDAYLDLEPYPDVVPGIQRLKGAGHGLVAFSNGVEATLRELLGRAGVLDHLDGIVSVDSIRTFKPHPAVYHHLAASLESSPDETWLVSTNYWDVIGARQAGIHAAWLKRDPQAVPDPWGIEPDMIVDTVEEFASAFS